MPAAVPRLLLIAFLAASPAAAQSWAQSPDSPVRVGEREGVAFPQARRIAQAAAGGGTMIGSDFDPGSRVYRFKFIRDGRVTWVDLDARSGQVLGVEGR